MDDNLALLIPILAISVGLVAVIGGVIVRPLVRLRERKMELEAQMVAEKAAQYAAHTERLEQRVRVLERIATDRGVDLASEIESLRDTPKPLN
jgi:flagellar biosynthesis/type III secretory pathway M-ring protein FliF/YscJ